jgi:prevent-host-death family protein
VDYVTVRELREKSGEIWQRVEAGEEFVITRNGKPFALLVHTQPAAVEADMRALRAARLGNLLERMQRGARDSGAAALTEDEIQAEVDAARSAQRTSRPTVLAAATRRHARGR